MNTFHTGRKAKEFVVSHIIEEAQREAVPLSDLERRMFYFSVTDASRETADTCEQFDRAHDQEQYEKKITRLIKKVDRRLGTEHREEYDRWRAAIRIVLDGEHYLAVMIARASLRPPWDFLKLVATGTAVVCALMGLIVLMNKYNIDMPSPEAQSFYVWVSLISAGLAYCLLRFIFGKDRFEDFISNLSEKVLKVPRKRN